MRCEHKKVRVEAVWDYESDQILALYTCEDCGIAKVGETWEEYLRKGKDDKIFGV